MLSAAPAAPFAAVGTAVHDREWWAVEAVHACTDWCGSVAAALEMMFAAGIIEEPAAQAMTPWDAPSWRDAAVEYHRDRPGRGRARMARAPRPSSILQSKFSKSNFTMTEHFEPLHTWESPDWSILDDRRGDLPRFPADCLGKAFMTVRRAAKGAGVTDAHVAVPMLGIASGLIGVARCIRASTSWLQPCTMCCGIVGLSGTGKTPGLEVTKRALAAVESEKRDDLAELRRKHDSKVEA